MKGAEDKRGEGSRGGGLSRRAYRIREHRAKEEEEGKGGVENRRGNGREGPEGRM